MFRSTCRSRRHRNPHTHDEPQQQLQSQAFFVKAPPQGLQRKPDPAFFQPKLTIGKPDDQYEREADAVANAVVNNSASNTIQQKRISGIQRLATPKEEKKLDSTNDARMLRDKELQEKPEVQKKCSECAKEEEEEKAVQAKPLSEKKEEELKKVQKKVSEEKEEKDEKIQTKCETTSTSAPPLTARIESSRGGGKSLPAKTLAEMSSSFGVDFSQVRIHNDAQATQMSREVRAQAFTHGYDIYFNSGKFNPDTSSGKQLLAHELTHVVQQNSMIRKKTIQRTIGDERDLSSPRFKGNVELEAAFDGEKVIRFGARGEHVKLIQQALVDAGFPLPRFGVDGIFKSETKGAVKEFQKQSGLEPAQQDGEVGSITMSRLDSRFTGGSATTVERTCENGVKTVKVDFVKMRSATGNASADIAFANNVFADCCIKFEKGKEVTIPDFVSDFLLGGDTDLLFGNCGSISSEDLITLLTAKLFFGVSAPIITFYTETIHIGSTREAGDSNSPLCATGLRAPLAGMIAVANGAPQRTFSHEIAHVLMNTFADHRVTADNLQHVSGGSTGERIAAVQCAIMYTRAK